MYFFEGGIENKVEEEYSSEGFVLVRIWGNGQKMVIEWHPV